MVSIQQIEQFGRRIGETFRPDKVILFGSYAWGRPTADSDVDLLIISSFQGDPVRQSVAIRMALRPSFPVDLLVRTPKKIEDRLALGDSFIREILEKGRCIYETPDR